MNILEYGLNMTGFPITLRLKAYRDDTAIQEVVIQKAAIKEAAIEKY